MKRWGVMASVAIVLAAGTAAAQGQASRDWLEGRLASNAAGRFDATSQGEPLADAIASWDRLRRSAYKPSFAEASAFLRAHRGWPQEAVIRTAAERAVGPSTPHAERIELFERLPPQTGPAKFRLAEAYLATGRAADAARLARSAWIETDLPPSLQAELQARFGAALTTADHVARTDAVLWARAIDAAERMLPLLPADHRAWAIARIALQRGTPDAVGLAARVGGPLAADPGLILDHARFLNENQDPAGARRLLADRVVAPGSARDPVRWMRYRVQLARDAARDGSPDLAYRVAAGHNAFPLGRPLNDRTLAERDALTDSEWLAGWLALTELRRPGDALRHFSRYQASARTPTTRAKGLYWAGRAAEAMGDGAQARRFLGEAGRDAETFYGQLALERIGQPLRLTVAPPATITAPERARFEGDALVRATRLLGEIGDRERQSLFLRALAERAASPGERRLVADLAPRFGRPDLGVIVGKAARAEGDPVAAYAYPKLALGPIYDAGWSMIHAITRQESQFNTQAVSSAGARGLMQLMPGTARETSGKMGLPYDFSRLTNDENYNVSLGSTYYRNMLDRWGGSHILAVASYNAGAGNVNKWVRANGDPRTAGVDPIAWIEAIPFTETRNYVHRVLENAVVYDALRPGTARTPEMNRLSSYLGKSRPG